LQFKNQAIVYVKMSQKYQVFILPQNLKTGDGGSAKFKLTFFLVTPQHLALNSFLRACNKVYAFLQQLTLQQ